MFDRSWTTGGMIPMFVFGVLMVLTVVILVPYITLAQRRRSRTIPDRSLIYKHDFFGSVKDSPLDKTSDFIIEKWGEPSLTIKDGNVVYRCWKVESAYRMEPDEELYFLFGFDRITDVCITLVSDPVMDPRKVIRDNRKKTNSGKR